MCIPGGLKSATARTRLSPLANGIEKAPMAAEASGCAKSAVKVAAAFGVSIVCCAQGGMSRVVWPSWMRSSARRIPVCVPASAVFGVRMVKPASFTV